MASDGINVLSASSRVQMGLGMQSSLRRPRRLAVLGIAGEAPLTMSCGRPGRAVAQAKDRRWLSQVAAGWGARLRRRRPNPLR